MKSVFTLYIPASKWLRKVNRMLYTYIESLAPAKVLCIVHYVVIKEEEPLLIDELAIGK